MIRLGVNVDHIATLRQARRGRVPEVLAAAHAAVLGGADLVTMHLREDRRHIQDEDVRLVRAGVAADLNLEIAATKEMIDFALEVRPEWVCLVPERREELTTEGGLDVPGQMDAVRAVVDALAPHGVQVSLFVEPDERVLLAAGETGAQAVELHTGRYANARGETAQVGEFVALRTAARTAHELGLRVHAGHGLDYRNVWRVASLPEVEELNIGFAIVARSVFTGLASAVREMREEMLRARELAEHGQ
jgi:pyridoxine 5-phosphate synthase